MESCPAFDPLGPYVTGLLGTIDCQALNLAEAGYRIMGSAAALGGLIGGLVTILIAMTGYRLLLGDRIGLREGVGIMLRIGIVLALAFQWAAYQPLVYDLVTRAPDDMAALLAGDSTADADVRATLAGRVQGVYGAMDALARPYPRASAATASPANPFQPDAAAAPATLSPDDQKAVGRAANMLLVASLGGLIGLRVIAGILLALGPLFIAGLLFEATRGLVSGWLRTLAGVAIASIVVPIVLAFELLVLEPQVVALARIVEAGETVRMLPGEILTTSSLFGLLLGSGVLLLIWACAALRLPEPLRLHLSGQDVPPSRSAPWAESNGPGKPAPIPQPSRAQLTGQMISQMERRDAQVQARMLPAAAGGSMARTRDGLQGYEPVQVPLGQGGRRTASRGSQAAARREGRMR